MWLEQLVFLFLLSCAIGFAIYLIFDVFKMHQQISDFESRKSKKKVDR